MNNEIINEISENLNIKKEGIEAVLKLLEEGNTDLLLLDIEKKLLAL